ncbi:MAG: type II-A CRISPR-associated protein Csn2 [Fusobacterium gastrosuis]|uniref:type II-A CRISPR-associated protein Csn2 n=1 Tax=Fusobacterium gastrosuis TaxID=1755100 RepID=UPI002970FD12|nr:type II-A CRISPR-associated protein Csn2 [Fusobacteriaceae bacterium]MDY4010978.1 type II-A CRISPR-associated protein Csn2 [Fusobacterium gastrosuis]MDY5713299.1 type II-A CRISPR-associated protein Csn2 [Fusobacterium gastrosuis]
MKLVYKNIEYILNLEENKVPVYIIENQKLFFTMLQDLHRQVNMSEEGNFSLFDDKNKELNISKNFLLISDVFNINFHDKKIINSIFSMLKEESLSEENYLLRLEAENKLKDFLQVLISDFEFPLEINEKFEYENLFKLFNIRIQENYENFLEKIIDYLKIITRLTSIKYIVFINLKTFLSKNELEKLYKESFYNKINIILFENYENNCIINVEKRIIVDSDLCEIY